MKKYYLWREIDEKVGAVIPADEVIEVIDAYDTPILVWGNIPGDKRWELEVPEEIQDLNPDDREGEVNAIVGEVGERVSGDFYEVPEGGCLAFDLKECFFFDTREAYIYRAYTYMKNTNLTYVVCWDEVEETRLEVVEKFCLDYQERWGSTDRTYGGVGQHANLWKVLVNDEKEWSGQVLIHFWSQWQGSELDQGYLLTKEEALEELAEHPEIEEIRVWLEGED